MKIHEFLLSGDLEIVQLGAKMMTAVVPRVLWETILSKYEIVNNYRRWKWKIDGENEITISASSNEYVSSPICNIIVNDPLIKSQYNDANVSLDISYDFKQNMKALKYDIDKMTHEINALKSEIIELKETYVRETI